MAYPGLYRDSLFYAMSPFHLVLFTSFLAAVPTSLAFILQSCKYLVVQTLLDTLYNALHMFHKFHLVFFIHLFIAVLPTTLITVLRVFTFPVVSLPHIFVHKFH